MSKSSLEALICPQCEGEVELDKDQEYGFCKYCGTKVQNTNFKIVKGTIKIDKEEELKNYLVIARRALVQKDYNQANKYFEMILQSEPDNWEGIFYTLYCKFILSEEKNLLSEKIIPNMQDNLDLSIKTIDEMCEPDTKEKNKLEIIIKMYNALKNKFEDYNFYYNSNYRKISFIDGSTVYTQVVEFLDHIYNVLNNELENNEKVNKCMLNVLITANDIESNWKFPTTRQENKAHNNSMLMRSNNIKSLYPEYKSPKFKSGIDDGGVKKMAMALLILILVSIIFFIAISK